MSRKKNILVFPSGSEVALEIYRSLKHSTYFNLIGCSSVEDHGRFVFESHTENIPNFNDDTFMKHLKHIIKEYEIDAIYPAMDSVLTKIKENESDLSIKVIGSSKETNEICESKVKTYERLTGADFLPAWSILKSDITVFPVLAKPCVGYGSKGVMLIEDSTVLEQFNPNIPYIYCDYLPGQEFTVDCFTNKSGELLFSKARERKRIKNGISVRTEESNIDTQSIANEINKKIEFSGAWFFQVKLDGNNNPKLLEVAARLGGSSGLFRAKGVNFAQATLFDAFGYDVTLLENSYSVISDRALTSEFHIQYQFNEVYVDLDDTLIVNNQVNYQLVGFLYQMYNLKKKIILITRHERDVKETLNRFRLTNLFDSIIHIKNIEEKKSAHIKSSSSIFIDDSFSERKDVALNLKGMVFSPEMLDGVTFV